MSFSRLVLPTPQCKSPFTNKEAVLSEFDTFSINPAPLQHLEALKSF
jgi:hypothetical protein